MTPEKMSIDDLLTAQSKQSCIATVEPVRDEPEMVKITPWVKGAGCLCHLALKIPKAAIESVTPTGDVHYCCGKTLRVVEIQFREDGAISLQDLFAQIMQAAEGGGLGGEPHPFDWRGSSARRAPATGCPVRAGVRSAVAARRLGSGTVWSGRDGSKWSGDIAWRDGSGP